MAEAIYEVLPKDKCDYFGETGSQVPGSDLLYIGFWTDKGNADKKTLELLSKLKGKKIFLFGTAGFGASAAYFEKVLGQVRQSVAPGNVVIGEYMCQGKMPQSVRERYIKMKENPEHPANLDLLIKNFDCALSHPDTDDLEKTEEDHYEIKTVYQQLPVSRSQCIQRFDFTAEKNIKYNTIALLKIPSGKTQKPQ